MNKITFTRLNDVTIEVDDSLNAHGGVGVDFWTVKNEGGTLRITLDFNETVELTKWLIEYLAKTNNS